MGLVTEMAKDIFVLGRSHVYQPSVPSGMALADSHAHFDKRLCTDPAKLEELVKIIFGSRVDFQAVCDYGFKQGSTPNVISYSDFIDAIRTRKEVEIVSSDKYATIARIGDKQIVFTQGRELETKLEDSKKGFLRDFHDVHIAVEGAEIQAGMTTYETLRSGEKQNAHMTIAHPFIVPAKKVFFWYANAQEEEDLVQIHEDFPQLYFEGINSPSTLWMVINNGRARNFAEQHNISLIWNSDMHARPHLDIVRRQIGLAGTVFKQEDLQDLRSLSGKEILDVKYAAIKKNGKGYGNYMSLPLFYTVMVKPRLFGFE